MGDQHKRSVTDPSRRTVIKSGAALAVQGTLGLVAPSVFGATRTREMPFDNGHRQLIAFPQKRPLILLTSRPPQLETPFEVFREGVITPNDAFFVRYHWSGIPTDIDPASYRLKIDGHVGNAMELSLRELRKIADPVELVAVNQCSGNSRGFSDPRVNGGQLGNGAMGNARWTGIPLRALLEKAGIKPGAVQVSFDGLDRPPLETGPDFVKALTVDHAMDGEVMLAWAMSGKDLPMLNGYPLRLVVPGHYGTYWVKHLSHIQVLDKPFDGFWMNAAYRIPANDCACVSPGTAPTSTVPIGRFNVRSFITSHMQDSVVPIGRDVIVKGIAFDGGHGIQDVAFSDDGGASWRAASLGKDLGRYSFREWTIAFRPDRKGTYDLRVRAKSRSGEMQPLTANWNPAGYMRNVVESTRVIVR
ncbi:molybdopterin-dependent oxidoreductase [Cupriavidus gilardii]|uniref:SorA family sulfite dehydrogenase catalytic subunit n=1 Tax=Cupriavidus gilardii TaxID=82541 RepID=UPI001580D825|nr:molybdopterin-dependent oxidoreductase [Cupriavidus gilardii]MCT9070204.1 molybdopterin-dependent oxidoreductase [Cupriavidus gilardii]QKS61380.1 molybdopterin-dependent oxidoreductase [Cupriavidus gilardii]